MKLSQLKRLFRVTLRTMLLITTVLCILLAWKVRRVNRQKEVVAWVEEIGGVVTYDYEIDRQTCLRIPNADTPVPRCLCKLIGVDFFADVEEIEVSNPQVTEVTTLENQTSLEVLRLNGTSVSDISALAKLTRLKTLDLGNTPVSDLSPIANLTNLEILLLHNTQATQLSAFVKLKLLQVLLLDDTPVTDLATLAQLQQLEILSLTNTAVTDLSPLANLSHLYSLDLRHTNITNEEITRLQEMLPSCKVLE